MSLDITVGSREILKLSPLKNLKKDLQADFKLPGELESQLAKPLSTMPAALKSVAIGYDGGPSWEPDDGEFTFSISAGGSGKLAVMLAGDTLVSYADEFETDISIGPEAKSDPPTPKTIPVPSGDAYVCIEFEFSIGGSALAEIPVGNFGIIGSANSKNTFGIAFYRKCKPTDTLHDAIGAAFSNFVLPLHPLTFNSLDVGDYLHHDFNATLQLGLGATIGYTDIFYAGQAAADLSGTATVFDPNPSIIPAFQAAATLAFNFSYTGSFEALLWKDNTTLGHMHLYRAKEQDTSLGPHLGIGLISSPVDSAAVVSTQLGTTFGNLLPTKLSTLFLDKGLPKLVDKAEDFASDMSDKISGWLEPINDAQATLDVAIATTKQTFILLDYTFDLSASAFPQAWKAALAGEFVTALSTPNGGVSIATGGGMEKFYNKKTSIDLNIFGQLKATWSDATIANTSMVYAGNNTFHLMANEGKQQLALLQNSKREIDIYFAAQADFSASGVKLGDVELHVVLQATNNPKYGKYLAGFLNLMAPAAGQAALAQSIAALAPVQGATETLHLIFDATAYGRLQASTIVHGKPDNQSPDQKNYAAFAKACSDLIAESPANFTYSNQPLDYNIWSNWNIACNDQWPASPGAVPDRTQSGDTTNGTNAYILGHQFTHANDNDATLISYSLLAASDFMNFCADLKTLAAHTEAGSGLNPWNDLVGRLKSIIQRDANQDFVAPASLALTRLCTNGQPPAEIGRPAPGLTDKNSIAVTVTYS